MEQNRAYLDIKDYKTSEETASYLGVHVETIYKYIANGDFPNAIKATFYSSQWKIPNHDIRSFEELKKNGLNANYYKVQEVANYYGVHLNTIHARLREGLFKDVITFKLTKYIGRDEVHSTRSELIKEMLGIEATFEERLYFYLRKVKNADLIPETINIFRSYLKHLISNTRMRKKHLLINSYCNMLINLSLRLNKEIQEHTDTEVMDLIASTTKLRKQLIGFLKFTLSSKSSQCKFQNKYNYTSKINTHTNKEIYSKSDFKKIYLYVNNINLHKNKALSEPGYAETWFYVFMHMTNAWRSSDIINFPRVDFSNVPQEYINSIYTDGITFTDAQVITNIVSEQWERFVSNKKNVLNKFLVNIDAIQTASTILLAIESHRRKQNYDGKFLLPLLQQKNSSISLYIKNFLKADDTLRPFSSRVANRSLMTYFFHSITRGPNNGDVAHLLAQRLRRHMSQDTISQYVMNTNEDEYLDDTSYNLFRRGHFGWLYNSLVEIVINKKDIELTSQEKTTIIESYQELYSPSRIEEISAYFLEHQNKNQSVSMEIALLPDDELKNRLYSIYKGSMPSKEENSQCFYSENCKNPTGNCKACPYIIPRTHLLTSLRMDLDEIISQIQELKEHDIYERIRKTHILYKLLNLISQAIKSFNKEYVESFIPLKPLQSKLEGINDMIFLPRKG
ncbi:hypothetical protein A9P44_03555 [Paenibacillus polymyxa]|nr:helix-turn-helix domain-containing protein [Paenibacillus polymyxa]OBA06007.1 hypothetical protein A9P44_03555 [Paenibacillus polymyxa]